jgi:hypothetical protein
MEADSELPADTTLRSSEYLNDLFEENHLGVTSRIARMLGFRRFRTAVTIAGIELLLSIGKSSRNASASAGSTLTDLWGKRHARARMIPLATDDFFPSFASVLSEYSCGIAGHICQRDQSAWAVYPSA